MRNVAGVVLLVLLIGSLSACSDDSCPYGPPPPEPIQLAEITFTAWGGTASVLTSTRLSFYYDGDSFAFQEIGLTDDCIGYSVALDTSDTGLSELFAKLTNGVDERMGARFGGMQVSNIESNLIAGGSTGDLRPDLNGTSITQAVVHIDRVILDSPGRDPNSNGIWTDYDFKVRLELIGFLHE